MNRDRVAAAVLAVLKKRVPAPEVVITCVPQDDPRDQLAIVRLIPKARFNEEQIEALKSEIQDVIFKTLSSHE